MPFLLAGCVLLGMHTASACDLPPLAVVPDAKAVAGKQQEITAEVQQYHKAMTAYADCIRDEIKAAGGDAAPPVTKSLLVARYNYAVAEVQAVLKLFDKNVGRPPTAPNRRFDNGGLDSAFPQFPGGGTPSSGQPRPPN
jgi:hypothetical protein